MSDRPLFHRNVATIDLARVQRDQGWVDLDIRFITEKISGFNDVCLFARRFHPAPPTSATFMPMLSNSSTSSAGAAASLEESGYEPVWAGS